jgi:hypothetical protein
LAPPNFISKKNLPQITLITLIFGIGKIEKLLEKKVSLPQITLITLIFGIGKIEKLLEKKVSLPQITLIFGAENHGFMAFLILRRCS